MLQQILQNIYDKIILQIILYIQFFYLHFHLSWCGRIQSVRIHLCVDLSIVDLNGLAIHMHSTWHVCTTFGQGESSLRKCDKPKSTFEDFSSVPLVDWHNTFCMRVCHFMINSTLKSQRIRDSGVNVSSVPFSGLTVWRVYRQYTIRRPHIVGISSCYLKYFIIHWISNRVRAYTSTFGLSSIISINIHSA